MKKVLVLSVVAIAIFAVASFASLSFSGGGSVNWNIYPFQTNCVTVSPYLNVSASGTDYSFSAGLSPWGLSDFYLTIPLMTNLSLVTGYNGPNFGETVFGGSNVNGTGSLGFWYSGSSYSHGLEYTSSALNLYVQSSGLATSSTIGLFGDTSMGPANLYGGMTSLLGNFSGATYYAGANVGVGPANLFGLLEYASNTPSYTVGAVVNMGSNQLGAEYSSSNNVTAWFDLGSNNEVNVAFTNMQFSSLGLTANNLFTVMGATGSLSASYSPSAWSASVKLSGNVPNTKGNVRWSLKPSYSSSTGFALTSSFSVSAF
ncbi:MAG: hypothetical protein C0176_01520 [Mesoaciditoga sp.]|uniref:hypothetical protein n=1 Tax=Athalassotoga sp. TaxID=2022597 RepID=UPI000CB46E56|nr:MAG: hypothetical protein C0185_00080 [Mesoaciditoga sp.]PMP80578.1 MAG: hypothetical protein C0176_01520 [Mesoaciditoga sp.]HEU24253.1 hypothetical protein [Mesoaciditoga lauensis]